MPDRSIVTLVPRETTPARPVHTTDPRPTERPLATVTPLPTVRPTGRVISPLDTARNVPAPGRRAHLAQVTDQEPGPLARALMELHEVADRR